MARHRMTVNGPVLFTPEEEAASDEEDLAWAAGAKDRHNEEMKRNRIKAYVKESDPIFFKAQRGEISIEDWLNKIEEIKNRYPYQE